MVDFNSVKQQVSSMVGMKFGSFDASVKSLDKKYGSTRQDRTKEWSDTHNGSTDSIYYDSKGQKQIAQTYLSKNSTDTQIAYAIFDNNTNRAYCTGWQDKNKASDKFTRIDFSWSDGGYYSVVDSNGNGIVDNDDTVTYSGKTNNDEKTSIKLKDLLG